MIKAVLFDIDNTLTWTEEKYIINVFSKVLIELKEKDWSKQDKLKLWYIYNRNYMLKARGISPSEFWASFVKNDKERMSYTHLFKDSRVIKNLKQRGLKIGLVTGAHEDIAELVKERIGKQYIDELVVANDAETSYLKPKPSPDSINHCLSKLDIKSFNACYIGNGDEDILAAKNANVYSVLVERKEHPLKITAKPDKKIKSLYEILSLTPHNY